jgi:hypothetical protein
MEHTISKPQKCKCIINSILLIFSIFSLLFSKNSQRNETTISDFCNNCRKIKLILQQKETICAPALTQAHSKLNEIICKFLNKSIINVYKEEGNRWNNQQIFAINGSRINGNQCKAELPLKLRNLTLINFINININFLLSQNETIKTN